METRKRKVEKDVEKKPAKPKAAKEEGKKAPALTQEILETEFTNQNDSKFTLKSILEKAEKGLVVFFYPKANTPGCTNQASLFRDSYKTLSEKGFEVLGASQDNPTPLLNWKNKLELPFDLVSDKDATLVKFLGVEKSGGGTVRSHFVFDKEGNVLHYLNPTPAKTSCSSVLEFVADL